MIKTVSVIGAGSWGTTLAKLLAEKEEFAVKLWVRKAEQAAIIKAKRENVYYLPAVKLPDNLAIISDLQDAVPADVLVISTPSHAMRDIAEKLAPLVSEKQLFVSCSKGLEDDSFLRMSEVIEKTIKNSLVAALSGPNHAEEVSQKEPTATVIACKDTVIAEELQKVFLTPYFRPYTNKDIIGVELGGAFKNIIAVAIGLLNGLGYKDNIKAATMTRGLAEISRLGVAMGAKAETFLGLSGTGDLITTCMSEHSRNRWAGEQLATGLKVKDILSKTNMVVEGIRVVKSAYNLANTFSIEMPITNELYKVIYEDKNVEKAVYDLMNRNYKSEN